MWSAVLIATLVAIANPAIFGRAQAQDSNSLLEPEDGSYPLLMPHVRPSKPETYLCTPIKLNPDETYYIVGFKPNATKMVAHHMLVFGCEKPGTDDAVWNCGEMARTNRESGMKTASPCSADNDARVVYAWAMDAPALELPRDVGFKVGAGSDIQYLVLQVHYATVDSFKDGKTDDSGVFLHYTTKPQPKTAGVVLMGTGGMIMPFSTTNMESACKVKEDMVIHPFAFRTHTHALGQVVSGYRVRKNPGNNQDEWLLIGKQDPQLPQMFYPVHNEMTIRKGDVIASRCTMKSNRMRITTVGPTNNHEMCNFYMMYWTEGPDPMEMTKCFTVGPPLFYWRWFPLRNIPADASELD